MLPAFTTSFDEDLLKFPAFEMRPFQLPFIGSNMPGFGSILFVMESHYIDPEFFQYQYDKENLKEEFPDLFYNVKANKLTNAFKAFLNTRQIIVESCSKDARKAKGKSVYRKLAGVVKEGLDLNKTNSTSPLDHIAIYNYFQRPSYKPAATIKVSEKDAVKAYETLKHIVSTVNIQKIIFTSAKAYDSFIKIDKVNNNSVQTNRKIFRGVHPRLWGNSCAYEEGISWKQWIVNRIKG